MKPHELRRKLLYMMIDEPVYHDGYCITRTSQHRVTISSALKRAALTAATWEQVVERILKWLDAPAETAIRQSPALGKHWQVRGRTSRFRFVYLNKRLNRWRVQIRYQGKLYHGGSYESEAWAAFVVNTLIKAKGWDLPLNDVPEDEIRQERRQAS